MSSRVVRVALVQMSCSGDMQANIDKAVEQISVAAKDGAHIVCLQEVFNTIYPCQSEDHTHFDFAETIPGPTSRAIQHAAKTNSVVVTCPIFEKRTHGLYHNSVITFDVDGETAGFYRKMHIPDDPLYYEKFYFTPGDLGFTIAKTKYGKLGVGICWDQWYPEAARLFALGGAEILLYPTAIGWLHEEKEEYGKAQHDSWELAMRAHAVANGLFVGAANRVGSEGGIQFWGASFMASPTGEVIQRASFDDEQTLLIDCELGALDVTRTHWPFLRDRRIDAYEGITKRYLETP